MLKYRKINFFQFLIKTVYLLNVCNAHYFLVVLFSLIWLSSIGEQTHYGDQHYSRFPIFSHLFSLSISKHTPQHTHSDSLNTRFSSGERDEITCTYKITGKTIVLWEPPTVLYIFVSELLLHAVCNGSFLWLERIRTVVHPCTYVSAGTLILAAIKCTSKVSALSNMSLSFKQHLAVVNKK
jgi:hypothetical protein